MFTHNISLQIENFKQRSSETLGCIQALQEAQYFTVNFSLPSQRTFGYRGKVLSWHSVLIKGGFQAEIVDET
jgi:hypothetical protein